jgi:hypothetical protein
MSDSEVKKCPKRGRDMEIGYLPGAWNWSAGKNFWRLRQPKRIFGNACKKCGYVEFYLEMKEKKEQP